MERFIHHSKKYNGSEGVVLDEKIELLIKMAIMHAQFESVPPFCDGNGRLGRILIVLMAMSYDLVDFPVFLVSEELAKERARYYALLNGIRGDNPDWYLWINFFLECCERMTSKQIEKMKNAEQFHRYEIFVTALLHLKMPSNRLLHTRQNGVLSHALCP